MLCAANSIAQDTTHNPFSAVIRQQAEEMAGYLLKKDFAKFCRYSHPQIIKIAGGNEGLIKLLKKGFEDFDKQGAELKSVRIGQPGMLIRHRGELQCVVPQYLGIQMPQGLLTSKSSLVAVSQDGGKRWYFTDTQGKPIEHARKKIPTLSPLLVIPPKGLLELHENE